MTKASHRLTTYSIADNTSHSSTFQMIALLSTLTPPYNRPSINTPPTSNLFNSCVV